MARSTTRHQILIQTQIPTPVPLLANSNALTAMELAALKKMIMHLLLLVLTDPNKDATNVESGMTLIYLPTITKHVVSVAEPDMLSKIDSYFIAFYSKVCLSHFCKIKITI